MIFNCMERIKRKIIKMERTGLVISQSLLQIIYTDVCRPFPNPTLCGQEYLIAFIYDISWSGYIYLISDKVCAIDMFKVSKTEVEKQFNMKIKIVRSDRGCKLNEKYDGIDQHKGKFANFL